MNDSASEPAGGVRRTKRGDFAVEKVDRLPPHSVPMEQGVLGCVLLSPNDCMGQVVDRIKHRGDEFYDLRNQTIYRVLLEMYESRDAIDVLTVHQRLKDLGKLDQVGGLTYLNELQEIVPSAANLMYYLDDLLAKHQMRRMIQVCTGVVSRVYEFTGELPVLLDEVERDVMAIRTNPLEGARPIKQLVHSAIGMIEEQWKRGGEISGISTGFPDLDRMTDGLHGGEMIVIAGRPSTGKTALAMNIAEHVAIGLKLPVGVFSLEMSADALIKRSVCSLGRVNLKNIRDGFMSESDFPRLTSAAGKLSNAPLFIDDTPGLSIMQFRARARRMFQQHGIKLFIGDYLQLMHSTSRKADENRQQEIADISSGVKALAKELNVPIIILSQLNREPEKTPGRKPKMSQLRESGAIEADADIVGLLYRPGDTDAEQNDESDGVPVNLCIAKQRNGPTGDVNFTFMRSFTRFESAAKVEDEDVPTDYQPRKPHASD